ncbi:MAG TPA: hypothetical protein VGN16_17620 [Acidobacteriaceae bacterium]|jgi:hypothetical protein
MSWDIFVQDFPPQAKTVDDIPREFKPASIGKRAEIIAGIIAATQIADFSNPCWGLIDGPDWSIEVNIDEDEECSGFALHVRGGEAAVGAVIAILQRLNLRALDSQTGDFFSEDQAAVESFRSWNKYRDQIVEPDGGDKSSET